MEPDSTTSISRSETQEVIETNIENVAIEINLDQMGEIEIDLNRYDLIELSVEMSIEGA